MGAAMLAGLMIGCAAAPGEEEVERASRASASAPQVGGAVARPAARVEEDARPGEDAGPESRGAKPVPAAPGTGRDEYDSLPIDCDRAIASRQEDARTVVYITPTQKGSARPGQWVHCAWKDRPPSSACEVLDIVDGGMLEASCGEVKPGSPRPAK